MITIARIAVAHIFGQNSVTEEAVDRYGNGKSVLATRIGDISEVFGKPGYSVEPSNPDQIAEKIQ